MRRRRLQHREPTPENKILVERAVAGWWYPCIIGLEATTPLRWSGREHLPEGPALILSNHASLFDPFFTIMAAKRPIHWLATQAAMQDPILGRVLYTFGSVPKKKFVADATAIRQLKKWSDYGGLVGSYPEGERSWDGELLPLLPGIESLVRLLKIPVVPVQVLNADRVMPRWAERRRSGQVKVVFGEPREFERKTKPELIREWLIEKLTIDQLDERNHFPVRSRGKLAAGLGNPLFRCPKCLAWDALIEADDDLRCRECLASWRITTHNTMEARSGGATTMTIVEARKQIRARNQADAFVVDQLRFEREGVVAQSEPMQLLDVSGDVAQPLGDWRMQLTAGALRFLDRAGEAKLELPLALIVNANVELRRRLNFRMKDHTTYEAALPAESPLKWAQLVEHWRLAAGASTEDA
ncbi:lysophospholipid acyltransferase family protein [Nannocystaceae bacterium ST9]